MFIPVNKYFRDGGDSLNYKPATLNSDEISTVVECGYEQRPFCGLMLVTMKNGEKLYCDLKMDALKETSA